MEAMIAKEAGRHLAELLRLARSERGWSQERLAEAAGLSADMVRRLESEKVSPTLRVLAKLAHGLQVDLAMLWSGPEDVAESRLGLDGLTQAERDFVTALARLIAAQRGPSPHS